MASMTGCNAPSSGDSDLIFMWFDVEGTVVNHQGRPIPGIMVYAESADPVETDSKGHFSVHGGGLPAEMTAIKFVDEDKEENGSFRTKTVVVDLVKYKEGQGWTEGYYKNKDKVVVTMTEDVELTPDSGQGNGQGGEQ